MYCIMQIKPLIQSIHHGPDDASVRGLKRGTILTPPSPPNAPDQLWAWEQALHVCCDVIFLPSLWQQKLRKAPQCPATYSASPPNPPRNIIISRLLQTHLCGQDHPAAGPTVPCHPCGITVATHTLRPTSSCQAHSLRPPVFFYCLNAPAAGVARGRRPQAAPNPTQSSKLRTNSQYRAPNATTPLSSSVTLSRRACLHQCPASTHGSHH